MRCASTDTGRRYRRLLKRKRKKKSNVAHRDFTQLVYNYGFQLILGRNNILVDKCVSDVF